MSLDALPGSVALPQTAGRLEIVQHLLTEALRTLQATNPPGTAPIKPVAFPASNTIRPTVSSKSPIRCCK